MRTLTILIGVWFFGFGISASAQSLFERCNTEKTRVADMERQIGQIETSIMDVDKQIQDLDQKQAELKREKARKVQEKMTLLNDIRREKQNTERMCSPLKQCENYENRIEQMKKRVEPLSEKMGAVRDEIRARRQESDRLNQETDQIENSYKQLNCENLVPGETQQSTIDRCSDLFSEWNHKQNDINNLQTSVEALHGRYKSLIDQLRSVNNEIAQLRQKMESSCSHSARLAELQTMENEQKDYNSLKVDLDDMDSKVKRFRAIRFVKPTLKVLKGDKKADKKEKKQKPTLKPVR